MTPPFVRVRPDLLARLYAEPPTVGRRYSMPLVAVTVAGLADRALRPCDGQDFPTIGELSRVVGWSTTAISNLLTDPDRWCHADSVEAWRRYWTFTAAARLPKKRAVEVATRVTTTCDSVVTDLSAGAGSTDGLAVKVVTRLPLTCRSVATRKLYARGSRGRARTDLQTDRPSDENKKPAPVPVADLFTPASQPDAATGEATGDTAPPPGCADPLPKTKRAPKVKPDLTADLARVLDALATLDPDRAQRARDGKNAGVIDEATKAIRLLGVDRIEARLRWAGANRAHKDVSWLLENQGWGAFFVHGKPMVNRMDDAAAMEASAPAGETDARSEAATAWFDMTTRRAWQTVNVTYFNHADDFGATTGFDLADTPAEHARRANAFRAAGSQPGWKRAGENGGAGKAAFRERFLAAYVAGVTV